MIPFQLFPMSYRSIDFSVRHKNNKKTGPVSDFESMDLLTLNRLRLGRNNKRSPEGQMISVTHSDKILEATHSILGLKSSYFAMLYKKLYKKIKTF